MMDCQISRDLVEKYLDGIISEAELARLKAHTETCRPCREEFDRSVLMQNLITQALSPQRDAEKAKESLVARLSAQPKPRPRLALFTAAWQRTAVAAVILLAVGLFLGFVLARTQPVKPADQPLTAQVLLRVSHVAGTVLVKHQGSDLWRPLDTLSNVYLGDTFHSTAKSAFTLEMIDSSTIKVNQNSMLVLNLCDGQTEFFLHHGACTAALESPHPPFSICTPQGRMVAVGTEFTVTVK